MCGCLYRKLSVRGEEVGRLAKKTTQTYANYTEQMINLEKERTRIKTHPFHAKRLYPCSIDLAEQVNLQL